MKLSGQEVVEAVLKKEKSPWWERFAKGEFWAGSERMRELWMIKAKFHYAIWFEAGRKQVGSWLATSFEPVCDQLRTSFEPASVTEFGSKNGESTEGEDG